MTGDRGGSFPVLVSGTSRNRLPASFTLHPLSIYTTPVCYTPGVDKQKLQKEYLGVISVTRKGVGYFPCEHLEEDIEIAPNKLGTALNGDEVEVRITKHGRGQRTQGEVTRIVNRVRDTFVGTLIQRDGFLTLHADNPRMYADIRIPVKGLPKDAREGHKALVRLSRWDPAQPNPLGEIVEVLGPAGAHETEMRAALAAHDFVIDFPPGVMKEAAAISARRDITKEETERRRDFRGVPTFTIDPDDAKDFDDALSFQKHDDGTYEVGIHIADVTHYVQPDSEMDQEARQRATSVYLVDRTIPMLPEVLSNDICSLRPDEDRLAFSAVFTMNDDAKVQDRWFGRTVIRSQKRFTYQEAQDVLDGKTGLFPEELQALDKLAIKMRREREARGAIGFDTDEVKFQLAADGTPLRAYVKDRLETMRMIEDWMLLANREVAEYIARQSGGLSKAGRDAPGLTFIYRVHDTPDDDRIEELRIFLRAIGYDLGRKGEQVASKDINKLLQEVKGTPEEAVVQMATLRSMAKAVYTHKNIGHFSLGFKHYTHFTSPIRRYPDMMVHRILASCLNDQPLPKHEIEKYRKAAITASEREIEAVAAERDSVKYKQVEYMSSRVGQTFTGTITGVTEHGFFVAENETKAEGMVRASSLKDDFYDLNKKHFALIGQRTKKAYRLGDQVRIKLVSADLESRQLDWEVAKGDAK